MAAPIVDLRSLPAATHERLMRLAIEQGRKNAAFPFGAVIVRALAEMPAILRAAMRRAA